MKRMIALLTAIMLLTSLVCGCVVTAPAAPAATPAPAEQSAEPAPQPESTPEPAPEETPAPAEETEELAPLPEIGENVSGFVVKEMGSLDLIGAKTVLFEHEKSGAQLLFIQNSDINRAFNIAFRTPALNDKGMPHVFEHITICGSEKYPAPNLFFPFAYRTYNTFVNAMTYHGMTTFPLASLSEEQLKVMMDYYLSGVFTPLLYTEPKLLEREAWRYELESADADLNVAGTVYSEMQGALTIAERATYNAFQALYEGGKTNYVSGGVPNDVRTIGYDEIIEFHDTYYHPSNALITLYGNIDYRDYLKFIDEEYLSKYDKKEIYVEMGKVKPLEATNVVTYEYPVEADSAVENSAYVSYSFALNGATLRDTMLASLVTSVLTNDASPLMERVRTELPHVSLKTNVDFDCCEPYISFMINGANEADRDVFIGIMDETIEQVAKDGLDQSIFDAVIAQQNFGVLSAIETGDLGVNLACLQSLVWVYYGTTDYYNDYLDLLSTVTVDDCNAAFKKFLAENKHRANVLTIPAPGEAEKNAQALKDELAAVKAAMTPEEIDALVKRSAEFIEWGSSPADDAVVSKFTVVDTQSLPEEVKTFDVSDENADGVRLLTAPAEVEGFGITNIMQDASAIPLDKLADVSLYTSLVGSLDTAKHTKEELATLTMRYLNGFSTGLSASSAHSGDPMFILSTSWMSMDKDYQTSAELANELLLETKFDDIELIKGIISQKKTSLKTTLNSSPVGMLYIMQLATEFEEYAFMNKISGIDSYAYLKEIEAELASDPKAFIARMDEARKLVSNKHGATALFAGDENGIASFKAAVPTIFAGMSDEALPAVDHSALLLPIKSRAVVTDVTVQFNSIAKRGDRDDYADSIVSSMLTEVYMYAQLRNALGAYGAFANTSRDMNIMYTYRDPNLAKSYEIMEALPEFMRTAEFTQEDLNNYINSSYSSLATPHGPLTEALSYLSNTLRGFGPDYKLNQMKQAKALTPEKVRVLADVYQNMIDNGARATFGSASAIEENADLFDEIIRIDW